MENFERYVAIDNKCAWPNLTLLPDGSYPSSVQLADGTIVTAYYCQRIATHQRYHMGVVFWENES